MDRKLDIEDRIKGVENSLEEKKSIERILKLLDLDEYINIKDYINDIILSTSDRIIALKSNQIIKSLKLVFKYNFIQINMIESWIMDLFVLLRYIIKWQI